MKKYRVDAVYEDHVELEVLVADDCDDPEDPENWIEVCSEHSNEYVLQDTQDHELLEECIPDQDGE